MRTSAMRCLSSRAWAAGCSRAQTRATVCRRCSAARWPVARSETCSATELRGLDMGLLGDSFDDPRTLATFNLAAGLLSGGNIGQSAMRGLAGYQGSMQSAAELAQKQQALEIQNIALQQAIRKFNLTMPLYEQAARYFGGGAPQAAAAGAPAPGSA